MMISISSEFTQHDRFCPQVLSNIPYPVLLIVHGNWFLDTNWSSSLENLAIYKK